MLFSILRNNIFVAGTIYSHYLLSQCLEFDANLLESWPIILLHYIQRCTILKLWSTNNDKETIFGIILACKCGVAVVERV